MVSLDFGFDLGLLHFDLELDWGLVSVEVGFNLALIGIDLGLVRFDLDLTSVWSTNIEL